MSIDYSYYSEINKLHFYVLGTEENFIDSAVSITNKDLFKGEIPIPNGVYDAAMGTTSYQYNCSTCHLGKAVCSGHSASLDLLYPVKSPLFRDSILRWLKVICFKCGRLLVNKNIEAASTKLLVEYVKLAKNIDMCPYEDCGEPHPTVCKDKFEQAKFTVEYGNRGKKEELFNHQIRDILRRISDETVLKLCKPLVAHPKNFILDIMRVPPNTIRPDIRRIGGSRSNNNDVTALTKKIVEINEALPLTIPPVNEITKDIRDMYLNLDMAYYEMVKGSSATNNQLRIAISSTNKAPSSIASRISKKTGRIRKNLMGKRTRYMIRSVLGGDASLRVDEIGLPISLARSLQIPETVRSYNIDKLNIYYVNKRNLYPGCSGIEIHETGKFHRIEHLDPEYVLKEGDIVYRDIIEGDYIGFNRQPSLLFGNISTMKVVIMEHGNTLRINVSSCSVFNADSTPKSGSEQVDAY